MLYAAEHVVIFGGWADSAKTKYTAYQEPGCHTDGPHHAFKYDCMHMCVGDTVELRGVQLRQRNLLVLRCCCYC